MFTKKEVGVGFVEWGGVEIKGWVLNIFTNLRCLEDIQVDIPSRQLRKSSGLGICIWELTFTFTAMKLDKATAQM